ncbi:MAG: FAD-binding oxidoreductase [Actinomycetota bacterium]
MRNLARAGEGLFTNKGHDQARARLSREYAAIPPGSPIRLSKRTSNLFRPRERAGGPGLDASGLDQVLSVDPAARTADVQAMTTYERLVDATLAHALMPLVVPQLKTITIGGAVTGLGIESSSFRNGLPHESVRELEVLTGAGEIVVARPTGENSDLFHAFPNSYGTLGYALRLVIELEPVLPFVRLRHIRFDNLEALSDAIADIIGTSAYGGEPVDFLDGTVFRQDDAYLTLGSWSATAPYTSDYTSRRIYYRSIRARETDYLTVRDYLWRWDTDWFWCSRAFGAQNRLIRALWPKRWLRSDVYAKLVRWETRHRVVARLDHLRGKPARERVVQDVEIPLARTAEFLRWFLDEVPIAPVWLCPLRLRATGGTATTGMATSPDVPPVPAAGEHGPWPLYPLRPDQTYVNIGFWSTVPILAESRDGEVNRRIERAVADHDGHKSLYSDSYYPPQEFWALYGGSTYAQVKARYDPGSRLLDLYAKAVGRR